MKFAIAIGLVSTLLCGAAQARDIEVDTVLMCESQHQAEKVAALLHGDAKNAVSAIAAVNAEESDPNACGVVDLVFVRGTKLGTIRAKGETFEIAPVLVVGIVTQTGVQPLPQAVYFSVFKIDERDA